MHVPTSLTLGPLTSLTMTVYNTHESLECLIRRKLIIFRLARPYIVTVGGFIAGTMQGWTSPAGPMLVDGRQYPFVVTEENVSWIAALMPLGALVGCLAMALGALDKWGRKSLLVMLTLPTVVGWQLIVKAQSVSVIPFRILLPRETLSKTKHNIRFIIQISRRFAGNRLTA